MKNFANNTIADILTTDIAFQKNIKYLLASNLSFAIKSQLVQNLLQLSIKKGNITTITLLQQQDPESYNTAFKNLKIAEISRLSELLNVKDPEFYTKHMLQFTSGFGRINYEGGLLTATQIGQRKQTYTYEPTILQDDEFEDYLNILKNATPPVREKFILTGTHWICGEIEINEQGKVKALYIDSLGTEGMPIGTIEAINDFHKVFNNVPHTLYIDNTKRQQAPAGCSVFALDDVRQLYVVENYLPEQYKEKGLFGYLEDNTKETQNISNNPIHITRLPIAFMRSAQTSRLETDILGAREPNEQQLAVNKKGQTASVSVEKHMRAHPVSQKLQNVRMDNKLEGIVKNNHQLLTTMPIDQIKGQMKQYSLESLPQKLAKNARSDLRNKK